MQSCKYNITSYIRKKDFAISNIKDVMFWTRGKQEIEVVDFLIRMKECMVSETDRMIYMLSHKFIHTQELANKSQHMPINPLLVQALHAQAKAILSKLPDDLQLVLSSYF